MVQRAKFHPRGYYSAANDRPTIITGGSAPSPCKVPVPCIPCNPPAREISARFPYYASFPVLARETRMSQRPVVCVCAAAVCVCVCGRCLCALLFCVYVHVCVCSCYLLVYFHVLMITPGRSRVLMVCRPAGEYLIGLNKKCCLDLVISSRIAPLKVM